MIHSFDAVVRQGLLDYAARHGRIDNPFSEKLSPDQHQRWDVGWARGFDLEAAQALRINMIGFEKLTASVYSSHGKDYVVVRDAFTAEVDIVVTQKFSSRQAAIRYGNEAFWLHNSRAPHWAAMPIRLIMRCLSRYSDGIRRRYQARCICSCGWLCGVANCERHGSPIV